jgi:hypothetical protein
VNSEFTLDILYSHDMTYSFYDRMRANGSPTALHRFVKGAERYMEAAVKDTIDRAAGRDPTIDEYIQLRAESSGVEWAYGN